MPSSSCTPRWLSPVGLPEAQRTIAERLPLLHELFAALLKPSCAKELEALCGGLALVAAPLPPLLAGAMAMWGVGALESLSGLNHPGAAKALFHLAVKGRAAAARAGAAPAQGGPAAADDLDLLQAVAVDVQRMINHPGGAWAGGALVLPPTLCAGGAPGPARHRPMCVDVPFLASSIPNLPASPPGADDAAEEGEQFGAIGARTYLAMLAVLGPHLDGVLGCGGRGVG